MEEEGVFFPSCNFSWFLTCLNNNNKKKSIKHWKHLIWFCKWRMLFWKSLGKMIPMVLEDLFKVFSQSIGRKWNVSLLISPSISRELFQDWKTQVHFPTLPKGRKTHISYGHFLKLLLCFLSGLFSDCNFLIGRVSPFLIKATRLPSSHFFLR